MQNEIHGPMNFFMFCIHYWVTTEKNEIDLLTVGVVVVFRFRSLLTHHYPKTVSVLIIPND